jgi:plasmid stabilization system protein ParE
MVNKIEFSRHSLAELGEILTYLQQNASEQAVNRFSDLVKKQLLQLRSNLMEGRPVPPFKTIRFVRIGKYHRMYYRKQGLILHITHFFDTRQDPGKQPY